MEYIVTHGTGTKLGDPVEFNALYDAFSAYTNEEAFARSHQLKPISATRLPRQALSV
ncbi:hypothetical protein QNN00_13085 [Bacillus velezensis]|nr:hypothetical protein [Bacillus velezensis]